MKLYELNKGDRFKADFYDAETDTLQLTVSATFHGMDGMYGKITLDGIKEMQYYDGMLEVEKFEA